MYICIYIIYCVYAVYFQALEAAQAALAQKVQRGRGILTLGAMGCHQEIHHVIQKGFKRISWDLKGLNGI